MRIGVVVLLLAVVSCGVPPIVDHLHVTYAADRSCQPSGTEIIDLIRVSALGDFPSSAATVALYSPAMAPAELDGFPPSTLLLAANAQTELFRFGGSRQLGDVATHGDLLLLPIGQPCGITDERITTHDGTAVVALPEGGALLVGGVIAGGVQSQVLRLDPGATTATLLAVGDGLAAPRTAAAVTLSAPPGADALVVVASGEDSSLHTVTSIELYDVAAGRFDATRCPGLALMQGRARAGAGALPDGRVLVAGGVDFMNHAFGTAELFDPRRCTAPTRIVMDAFVVAPWIGALDDGTVMAAGGDLDRFGTRSPNTNIWVFSADDRAFAPYPDRLEFRALDSATVVPLPGARLAHVGFGHGTNALQVEVLYTTGTPFVTSVDLGSAPLMSRVSATALPDGRLLVAGADMTMSPVAYVVDLATEDATGAALERAISNVAAKVRATSLHTLADGVVLELAPEGASLRRTSTLTAFDNPSQLVGQFPALGDLGLADVALDDAAHWSIVSGPCPLGDGSTCPALEAQTTFGGVARLDAATLRYGDAHLSLDITGNATLLLSARGVSTKTIAITDTQVSLAGCSAAVPRAAHDTVTIDRSGDTLILGTTGGPTATCAATFGGERFALGLAASAGTRVFGLAVTRH